MSNLQCCLHFCFTYGHNERKRESCNNWLIDSTRQALTDSHYIEAGIRSFEIPHETSKTPSDIRDVGSVARIGCR
ncbi:MAG: hypothetical protein ACREMA_07315 [Longimicrobiales bacterium]